MKIELFEHKMHFGLHLDGQYRGWVNKDDFHWYIELFTEDGSFQSLCGKARNLEGGKRILLILAEEAVAHDQFLEKDF